MKAESLLAFVFCLLFSPAVSGADDPKYVISAIPPELLVDAKAVIRKKDIVFEISDYDKAVLKVTYAITILNKNGIENSVFHEVYDKFLSVRKIDATIFDRNGRQVRTGLNTKVRDIAVLSGYSLYNDMRMKVYDPGYTTTPFTVEYSYEIAYDGLFNYPDWNLYSDYNLAVENSTFRVLAPREFALRYLEQNIKSPCKRSIISSSDIYDWEISGLPAIKRELYSPDPEEYTPSVFLAPDDFEIGGIKGNCESWSNLGLWIRELSDKKDVLGAKTIEMVRSIAAHGYDEYSTVRLVYEYLQNKVRYVSVSEGLGGWQPIAAEIVDRVSYGDCKALANYMKSLLAIAGINSYYTIIRAGAQAPVLREGFPSNQFNHAIVCVPLKSDTIWLECTDQQIPFGFLGSFTDDRRALLITESGGKMVKTVAYTAADNVQVRKATVNISNDGSTLLSVNTSYSGIKYDEMFRVLRMDDEDRKRFIYERLKIAGCSLQSFHYSEDKSVVPSMSEELQLSVPAYGTKSETRMILVPNMLTRLADIPVSSVQRKSPIFIRRSYCEYDTVVYVFQRICKSESIPENFSLKTPFGEYECKMHLDRNRLTYTRSFKLMKGNFPSEMYESFCTFFEKVRNGDNRQLVLTGL